MEKIEYKLIATNVGLNKLNNAALLERPIKLVSWVVGDGGGESYQVEAYQTQLKNQVDSGRLNSVTPNTETTSSIEFIIDHARGPYFVREVGFLDSEGDLIYIASVPTQEKVNSESSVTDMTFEFLINFFNSDAITFVVDPNKAVASHTHVSNELKRATGYCGTWQESPYLKNEGDFVYCANSMRRFRPIKYPYQVNSSANPNALVGTELVDVSELLSKSQALQMSQIFTAHNTTDMIQSRASGNNIITPEVGQYWSVLGVDYRRISGSDSLSGFRIETREVEYSSLIEALSEKAVLQVGNFVSIAGHNTPGDGGAARFEVVLSTEKIGMPNNAGTIKLKRIEGQEQWKAQYAGSLPKFIAHRGAAGYTEKNLYFVPENTIYSARRSAEAGFWGLESDAKVTADGQIAVFHDLTVDRTITGQTGPVSSFTMSQLKSFDAGSYVSSIYTNARVMDYNDWFASCRKFSLVPCAEISVAMTDAQVDTFIADCLQYYPDGVGVFLQSTNLETLQKIRAKNANITLYRSFSYGSVPDVSLFDDMYALGNAGVHFSGGALNNDPSIVQAAKDRGLCTSYAIANTAELVKTARDLGIHRIMTDFILGDY